jgi:hypothetical protein
MLSPVPEPVQLTLGDFLGNECVSEKSSVICFPAGSRLMDDTRDATHAERPCRRRLKVAILSPIVSGLNRIV